MRTGQVEIEIRFLTSAAQSLESPALGNMQNAYANVRSASTQHHRIPQHVSGYISATRRIDSVIPALMHCTPDGMQPDSRLACIVEKRGVRCRLQHLE